MSIGNTLRGLGCCVFLFSTAGAQSPGAYLGELSWPQAMERIARSPVVVVPFGAGAKEHGPHLPMNTDRLVLEYLLERAVEAEDVAIAPPVLHGWLPAFRHFPGTEISDAAVFTRYMQEIAESLIQSGAQRLVFLNTGIAKASGLPISIAAREIRVETGVPTLVVSWDDLETDETAALAEQSAGGHGDEIETSIMLHLAPQLVDMSRAVTDYRRGATQDYGGYRPGVFARNTTDPAYSETGIYGDATLATAEKGERALEIMTAEWLGALRGFARTPLVREE